MEATLNPTAVDENNVCYVEISRTDKGINLFFKSKKIEEFMHKNHAYPKHVDGVDRSKFRYVETPGWRDHLGYIINQGDVKGLSNNMINNWGADLYLNGNGPNLSFLLAKGLGNGVTFELEGIFSQTSVNKWASDAKVYITNFYREFLKTCNLSLSISLVEIQ